MGPRWELSAWLVSSLALYGVRVRRIGLPLAPFGTRMTVCSFAPSRMGIISSRLIWSKLSVAGSNLAGVSLGKAGYVAGVAGGVWATSACASMASVHTPIEFMEVLSYSDL